MKTVFSFPEQEYYFHAPKSLGALFYLKTQCWETQIVHITRIATMIIEYRPHLILTGLRFVGEGRETRAVVHGGNTKRTALMTASTNEGKGSLRES